MRRRTERALVRALQHRSKPRVLVVDDAPDLHHLVRSFLRRTPCDLQFALNGRLGLDAIQNESEGHFDLVLMDLQMPVMDGVASVRALRKWEKKQGRRPVTVVAVSGYAPEEMQQAALNDGCDAYLRKPFDKAALLTCVADLISAAPEYDEED